MDNNPKPEENLADEFRNLGQNLVEILHTAWEAPERKRLQQELENGLNELGNTLRREAENFASSPGGQQLKAEINDFSERVRSGEVQNKAHDELLGALQTANAELQKLIQQWTANRQSQAPTPPEAQDTGKTGE